MDPKKLILFVIFIISLSFLYENWQDLVRAQSSAQTGASVTASAEGVMVHSGVAGTVPVAVVSAAKGVVTTPARTVRPSVAAARLVWVTTDVLRVGINPVGGTLEELFLLGIHQSLHDHQPILLFNNDGKSHFYVAESGLASVNGVSYPNHTTPFHVATDHYQMAPGQDVLRVSFEAEVHGIRLTKTYVFHRGAYRILLDQSIKNIGQKPIVPTLYFQLLRDSSVPPSVSRFVNTFTGPALYTEEDKFHKFSFSDLNERTTPFSTTSSFGWVAFIQHYFVGAWVPTVPLRLSLYADRVGPGIYRIGFQQSLSAIESGHSAETQTVLFAGPQREALLTQVHSSFDLVRDYGWLTFLSKPLFWVLNIFHDWVGNWGWSIVLLTLLVKLIFFPLSAASYRSMAKMKVLSPAMQLIRERYADDKQKQQQEMMALFRKEKVNPMLGCLPMLVQIPVFIALYYALMESAELRQAPWIFWIQDLSVHDPFYILPIILAITTFIQVRLNPSGGDPTQARMMMIMPMIFSIMFFFFPAGLVLYWFVSNLFSLVQQWYMTRVVGRVSHAV